MTATDFKLQQLTMENMLLKHTIREMLAKRDGIENPISEETCT